MDPLQDLYDLIERAIVEEPPIVTREGGMIKEGYNEEADKLRHAKNRRKDLAGGVRGQRTGG